MAGINKKEHWAELYRRALFEEDRNKLPLLLEQAHQAVQQRVRELWYSPTRGQNVAHRERQELHTTAYYLGLLRSLEASKTFGEDPLFTNKATATGAVDSGKVEDIDFNTRKSTEEVLTDVSLDRGG